FYWSNNRDNGYLSWSLVVLFFFSLAFIFEAEIAEGVFFIPAFFITSLITQKITLFVNKRTGKFVILGLSLPVIPRIAFEIKNNELVESIKEIVTANIAVKEVKAIKIYSDYKNEYADIKCVLKDNPTVEEAHNIATDLERKIGESYRNLNVTLHIEADEVKNL
ncbi:MAG: cation transporter dimerization domain-containing protein, partial [Nitrososphaerales archaeon]